MHKFLPWLLSLIKTEIQCKRHKLNSAKSIKNTVQEEIKWFAAPYDIPATVHWPATSSIEQLKDLLYSVRYDKVILPYGTSPNKLSTICLNQWLSCDPGHQMANEIPKWITVPYILSLP